MIVRSTKSCRFEKTVEMENIFTEETTDHYRTQIRNKNGDPHLVHIPGSRAKVHRRSYRF